jgi:hypothetical protein
MDINTLLTTAIVKSVLFNQGGIVYDCHVFMSENDLFSLKIKAQ